MSGARYLGQFRPEFSRLHQDQDLLWVVPFPVRYVLAVSGERFAGKSTVLNYLAEKRSFIIYSLTTVLREVAAERGVPVEPRINLQDLGDQLRAERGDTKVLARLTLRRIHLAHQTHRPAAQAAPRIAVGGFKRPEEIEAFERLLRFSHVTISAPAETRCQRAKQTGILSREVGKITDLNHFTATVDKRDLYGDDNRWTAGHGQAVSEVIARPSARRIDNQGDIAALYQQLDAVVDDLDERFRIATARPRPQTAEGE